jgi:hypothetical protein
MEGALEEYGTPIHYKPSTRSYYIEYGTVFKDIETGKDAFGLTELLIYCPWCGVQLPKDLIDEWVEIVKSKFNIKDTLDKKELKKIPKEYMTDEWWKKRGL